MGTFALLKINTMIHSGDFRTFVIIKKSADRDRVESHRNTFGNTLSYNFLKNEHLRWKSTKKLQTTDKIRNITKKVTKTFQLYYVSKCAD